MVKWVVEGWGEGWWLASVTWRRCRDCNVSRWLEDGVVTGLGLGGSDFGVVIRDDLDVGLVLMVASQTELRWVP